VQSATSTRPKTSAAPLVSFRHVSKRFPGARALEDVSFDVRRGSCHALCGENGAGKSTLGKLLAGIEQPDGGEIIVDGRAVQFDDPRDALAAGIGMVHQELAFCENLSACSFRAARWRSAPPRCSPRSTRRSTCAASSAS
jgi:ABC-type sugar transport system ATPase subunit